MSSTSDDNEKGKVIYLGMEPWKKRALIITLVLVLLAGLTVWIWVGYEVKEVSVTGNKHYTREQIIDMVMTGPLGHNSLFLFLKYRNRPVEDIPFIETMDVKILSPDSISITVYEKAIAGCVCYLDRYMYFDKDGIVVESSVARHADMPYVTGLEFDHVVLYEKLPVENEEIFDSILTITQLLSKYNIDSDQIYFDPEKKITLYFGDARVYLGSMDNIDEKMNELNGIAGKLAGLSGVLYLDTYEPGSDTGNITFQRDDVQQHEELPEMAPDIDAGGDEEGAGDGSEDGGAGAAGD